MIRSIMTTIAFMAAMTALPVSAVETQTSSINPACPDANVFSQKLVSDIDWTNLYPIRIAGAKLGGGEVPDGAAGAQVFCMCPDANGVPYFGTQIGLWRPIRLIEVVRTASCSPAMGGATLQSNPRLLGGPKTDHKDATDVPFYNVNVWAFPITTMLNMFTSVRCNNDYFMDIDLINISTIDPTWNDEELSLIFTPEAFIFATPPALALQLMDAAASTIGKPMNRALGSAGTWGSLYPMTGFGITIGSPPQISSLIATKALAKLHRIGFARRNMGDDVMCSAKRSPTITKTQYKLSTFFPVPEIRGNLANTLSGLTNRTVKGSHVIGAPTFQWGEWRNRPGSGEDFLYIVWSWMDCCASSEE